MSRREQRARVVLGEHADEALDGTFAEWIMTGR